jgi:8-oxo-dGTP pyrophosphatase MutT (NUDIX family)
MEDNTSKSFNPGWVLKQRHVLYQAANPDEISLLGDDVIAPSGHEFTYVHVDCPYEAVFAIGVDAKLNVLMIRQYRYVVGEEVWEVPAGSPEGQESLEEGALREFEEEGGYTATEITKLGSFYASIGITNQKCHVFMVRGLTRTTQNLGIGENLRVKWIPLQEAVSLVLGNSVSNVGSAYGLLLAKAYLDQTA